MCLFFFQAEDGIRDYKVTGVQTCALPISKKKPFETLSVSDIGVAVSDAGEAGSKTEVLALGDPPARADARKIEGDGNAAQAILEIGRASCRERGWVGVVAVALKNKRQIGE